MRTLTSKRYSLLGFNDKGEYTGWVFTDHSPVSSGDAAILIVGKCKFVDNGTVYYLRQDGTYNTNSSSDAEQARELAYAYL